MENWTLFTSGTLRGPEPYFNSTITPLHFQLPMVAVEDIGSTFATGLLSSYAPPTKPYVFALHGPKEYSPDDAQAAFSQATGKHVAVRAIEKDQMADFFSTFLPPSLVGIWVEMSSSFLPGGVAAPGADGLETVDIVRGTVTLEKAIKDAIEADN